MRGGATPSHLFLAVRQGKQAKAERFCAGCEPFEPEDAALTCMLRMEDPML